MTETNEDNKNRSDFFVFDKLRLRRLYPVNFLLMGVLGDLCLTRVNNDIFDYADTEQLKPLNQVFMCDVLPGPDKNPIDFLKELYKKCDGYGCLGGYFKKSFLKKIEIGKKQQNINTPELFDQLLIEFFEEQLNNDEYKKTIDPLEPLKSMLKPLGMFLVENYKTSGTSSEIKTILSMKPDEMHWIFYMGIPPTKYKEVIESIENYFSNSMSYENHSGPARVFLLEKPLQENYVKADEFSEILKNDKNKFEKLRFHFFAVDHYAAKWALWQLPVLNEIPNFSNFIDRVDEIIIELLEDKTIPELRLNYMARTGLFFDMMPHALIPIQFLFAGKSLKCDKVKKIIVGYYKGYESDVEKWRKKEVQKSFECIAKKNIKYETYFSLELELIVSDRKKPGEESKKIDEGASKKIDVFIRSGKGLIEERKRVILKRRENKANNIELGRFIIDIKGDKFEPYTESASLPPHILEPEVAGKHIRGHARILYDVMEYLSTLNNGSTERSKIVELLSIDNAAEIIRCIEYIKKKMIDWPKDISEMKPYERGKEIVLDESKEKKFLYP